MAARSARAARRLRAGHDDVADAHGRQQPAEAGGASRLGHPQHLGDGLRRVRRRAGKEVGGVGRAVAGRGVAQALLVRPAVEREGVGVAEPEHPERSLVRLRLHPGHRVGHARGGQVPATVREGAEDRQCHRHQRGAHAQRRGLAPAELVAAQVGLEGGRAQRRRHREGHGRRRQQDVGRLQGEGEPALPGGPGHADAGQRHHPQPDGPAQPPVVAQDEGEGGDDEQRPAQRRRAQRSDLEAQQGAQPGLVGGQAGDAHDGAPAPWQQEVERPREQEHGGDGYRADGENHRLGGLGQAPAGDERPEQQSHRHDHHDEGGARDEGGEDRHAGAEGDDVAPQRPGIVVAERREMRHPHEGGEQPRRRRVDEHGAPTAPGQGVVGERHRQVGDDDDQPGQRRPEVAAEAPGADRRHRPHAQDQDLLQDVDAAEQDQAGRPQEPEQRRGRRSRPQAGGAPAVDVVGQQRQRVRERRQLADRRQVAGDQLAAAHQDRQHEQAQEHRRRPRRSLPDRLDQLVAGADQGLGPFLGVQAALEVGGEPDAAPHLEAPHLAVGDDPRRLHRLAQRPQPGELPQVPDPRPGQGPGLAPAPGEEGDHGLDER